MAKNIEKIADLLGANVVSQLPETGGGAFGAARLGRLVGWQSGILYANGIRKPSYETFRDVVAGVNDDQVDCASVPGVTFVPESSTP